MKYVLRYVKPHIPTMIFGFTIKFTGTILDLMIPYILSYIIDEVTPRNDIGLVIRWGLMMAVCAALVLVCNVWATGWPPPFPGIPSRPSAMTFFIRSPVFPAARWTPLRSHPW